MTGENELPAADTQTTQQTSGSVTDCQQSAPPQPFQTPEDLVQAARLHRLVPLVGAGISKHATLPDGSSFPSWAELLTRLAQEACRRRRLSKSDYEQIVGKDGLLEQGKCLMVAQTLCERLERKYRVIIQQVFDPPDVRPGDIHIALWRLGAPLILTTNYDRLLEHAYSFVYPGSPEVCKHKDAELIQGKLQNWQESDPPALFKLHGCVSDLKSIILSEEDYRELHYRTPGYQTIMSAVIVTHTILMMGFSFDDPDVRRLLTVIRESLKYSSQPHYILLAEDKVSPIKEDRYREDFNLETITYKASKGHPEIVQFAKALIARVNEASPSEYMKAPSARIIRRFINRDPSRSAHIISS